MKQRPIVYAYWLLMASIIAYGVYYLSLGAVMSEPNAEDYALSIEPRDLGLIPSVVNLLVYFDSRYTANLLHGLNVLVLNRYDLFWIMPMSCLVGLWLSSYFLLGSWWPHQGNRVRLAVGAALMVMAYYAICPSLPFGLYYMASTFTYIFPCMFWMLWVGCLWRSMEEEKYTSIYSLVGLSALVLSFGSSELFIVINALTLASFMAYALLKNWRLLYAIFPYGLVAIGCLLFILNCPSNKFTNERIWGELNERYAGTHFILVSMLYFIKWTFKTFFSFTSFSFFICFIALLHATKSKPLNALTTKQTLLFYGIIQLLLYLISWVYFIPRGSTNDHPVYILNVLIFFNLLATYLLLAPLFLKSKLFKLLSERNHKMIIGLCLCLVFLALENNNFALINREYTSGVLSDVKKKQAAFYKQVDSVKQFHLHPTIVYFQNPTVPPQSNYHGPDVMPNREAADWNYAYEKYFGVDEVRLMGDTLFK